MRYLKTYNESSKLYHQMSDDDLNDWLDQLSIERDDILERISSIRLELRNRKERSEEEHSKNLPDSVFDLNKEQFDWIFEHNYGITTKKYEISKTYIRQLSGVIDSGFNRETSQFFFNIATKYSFNSNEDGFELNLDVVKSIKFLGENLKRVNDYVEFGVLFYYDGHGYNERVKYYSDNHLEYGSYGHFNRVDSIEKLLERLVDNDILNKNRDDNW